MAVCGGEAVAVLVVEGRGGSKIGMRQLPDGEVREKGGRRKEGLC